MVYIPNCDTVTIKRKKTFFNALTEWVLFETNLKMNCFTFEDWIVPWGDEKEEEHYSKGYILFFQSA